MKDSRIDRDHNYLACVLQKFITSFFFKSYKLLNPNHPHFTPQSIIYLENYLNTKMIVFEWGTGKSTSWFSPRVLKVISVEHDTIWYKKAVKNLKSKGLNNIEIHYVLPMNPDELKSFSWPSDWKYFDLLKHHPKKTQFFRYISKIDMYDDEYFDCIIIDGRERVGCLVYAIPKLKPGGIIVLDDSFRPKYEEFYKILSGWFIKKFDFGYLQTTIFQKPVCAYRA